MNVNLLERNTMPAAGGGDDGNFDDPHADVMPEGEDDDSHHVLFGFLELEELLELEDAFQQPAARTEEPEATPAQPAAPRPLHNKGYSMEELGRGNAMPVRLGGPAVASVFRVSEARRHRLAITDREARATGRIAGKASFTMYI